jgi:DNA-binding SARP family transcriptional activator
MDRPARLEVRLFGAATLVFDGVPWTAWMPPRCLLLLALIAARCEDSPTRASLAATLWPDEIDSDARTNLRRHLHELARGLPQIDGVEWIVYEGKNLRWNDDAPAWIDVRAFQRLQSDSESATLAAALYRGALLDGVFDEAIVAERERLAAMHRELLVRLVRAARHSRDVPAAIARARELLDADEWREDALREWMSASYQSGNRDGALQAYDEFSKRLHSEFAAAPTPETIALRDAIRSDLPLPDAAEERYEDALSEPARRAWNLPFVGRDDDLTRLRSIWTRAARGNGGTAFVSGEAGIGKSRLASELAAIAREQGAYVLRGVAPDPETTPYQAVLDALRGSLAHLLAAQAGTPWLAALARVLPEIREANADVPLLEERTDKRASEGLFDAVASAIAHLARMRPLCIVLEDLHWAGPATIDLVESLARRVGSLPVMLLVTYRSENSTGAHPLRALRATLVRERRAAALPLERLRAADVGKIVETVAKRAAERELDDRIARLSEGNPLFVAQLLEGYRETGALPDEASALHSVGDAIAVRIERIDPEIRSIAQAAATVGQPFRSEVVAEIGGWSAGDVLDALGALMDRSLVSEAGEGPGYAFTHALIGAAFYNAVDADVRAGRHVRVAGILERSRHDDRAALGAIARHWELGGRIPEAATAYVRAANGAASIYAREEAATAAQHAYDLTSDARTRFDAMYVSATVRSSTVDVIRWRTDIERLEIEAASLDDEARFTAMRMRERYACQVVDFEMHERSVNDLDAFAAASSEARHRAYAGYARGYYNMQRGNLEGARASLERGLEAALVADDAEEIARTREEFIVALMRCAEWDEARRQFELQKELTAHRSVSGVRRLAMLGLETTFAAIAEDGPRLERGARELLEASTRLGDSYNIAKAHMLLTQSTGLRFDLGAMREHRRIATELFDRIGELRASAIMSVNYAGSEVHAGRGDLGLRALHEAGPAFERLGTSDILGIVENCRAEAFLLADAYAEALTAARLAFEVTTATGEPRHVCEAQTSLGAAEGRNGNVDAAIAHLLEAIANSRVNESPQQTAYAIAWLIEICCDVEKRAVAEPFVEELHHLVTDRRGIIGFPTFVCYALARMAQSDAGKERWSALGREILQQVLARLTDPADAGAYKRLFFNRGLTKPESPKKGRRKLQ